MKKETYTYTLGSSDIVFEVNDWMSHTESSVVVSMGDTQVMVALALGPESDKDYLPLKVEYQERFYAAGEILGGKYNKREGKPSTEAILTARVVDRAIRPFFPEGFNREVLVVITVLSLGDYDPDILALNGASFVLQTSQIPWSGSVAAARIVGTDENTILSPTYRDAQDISYDATVAIREGKLVMLEVEAGEVSEQLLNSALESALQEIEEFNNFIVHTASKHAKTPLETLVTGYVHEDIFNEHVSQELSQNLAGISDKEQYSTWLNLFITKAQEVDPDTKSGLLSRSFDHFAKQYVRSEALDGKRLDGRALDEVRELQAQVGTLPKQVHGSGLFYRGDTHVLSALTLGKLEDALHIDGMEIQTTKNFIHHYNFPPYSVGEVGRIGSPKRREIGHGQLAEKAFRRVLPTQEEFPYTMRVVSEVLSSNGSTSMASVCGTSLALHYAGVPLKSHVAGIAIGLVYSSKNSYALLTDILGKEDHYGDMDFKVAGTRNGITAIQLDCKFDGLTSDMILGALVAAKQAREKILDVLEKEIPEPNKLTDQVEQIKTISIPQDKIGLVIGKGGATIKKITAESGAKIDIKRDGTAFIYGNQSSIDIAHERVTAIVS